MLEGVIPLETFPLVEWHYGELADVPSFTVLKTQICVTRPQCVKNIGFAGALNYQPARFTNMFLAGPLCPYLDLNPVPSSRYSD